MMRVMMMNRMMMTQTMTRMTMIQMTIPMMLTRTMTQVTIPMTAMIPLMLKISTHIVQHWKCLHVMMPLMMMVIIIAQSTKTRKVAMVLWHRMVFMEKETLIQDTQQLRQLPMRRPNN